MVRNPSLSSLKIKAYHGARSFPGAGPAGIVVGARIGGAGPDRQNNKAAANTKSPPHPNSRMPPTTAARTTGERDAGFRKGLSAADGSSRSFG